MTADLTRRDWMASISATLAGAAALRTGARAEASPRQGPREAGPFRFCLNTSTIRGQELPIVEEVDIAAEVGYQAIEPWIRELDEYVQGGGDLGDLGKRIRDKGLTVDSAIGFPEWAVDDQERRRKGLDEARRNMDMLRAIGGTRLAAPPVGLTDVEGADLRRVADRFRVLLELGAELAVTPQLEVWGFSKTLSRLGEAAFVVIEAGHPDACILADIYHIYKGGSDFESMRFLDWGATSHVFHMNDFPAIPAAQIKDADRVFPGDGVAPLTRTLRTLRDSGFHGTLSLELFNPEYWKRDPREVARRGLESMHEAVFRAMEA